MIARYCVIIAACIAVSGISVWTGNILLSRLSFLTVRDVRRELYSKLLTAPLSEIERRSRGDLMTRMTAFGENLSDGLYQGIMQLSAGAVTLLMTIVCMYVMNWAVATIVVLAHARIRVRFGGDSQAQPHGSSPGRARIWKR